MRIRIRFFASLREALGASSLELQTHATTVGELRAELRQRGTVWSESLAPGQSVRASMDQNMVADNAMLVDGAEVAFFPPVTGG